MATFNDFETFAIPTQDDPIVTIIGAHSPPSRQQLPPLLLLHGFPQTRHMWHRVAPQLVGKYNIIVPDIRGYGASSKPTSVANYAKSAMAKDMVTLMKKLGHETFFVCAHDRGARIAHKMLVDYPDVVRKAIILDICPTLAMYEATSFEFAKACFHWYFLIQPAPLPETLINATPRKFADLYMGGREGHTLEIFDKACYEKYAALFENPDGVHAMCNDYRAAATLDLDEQTADLAEGRLIRTPLRVIWGKKSHIEKCFDGLKEWQAVADKNVLVEGYSVDSGHYIPEETPDEVVKAILEFCV